MLFKTRKNSGSLQSEGKISARSAGGVPGIRFRTAVTVAFITPYIFSNITTTVFTLFKF